MEGESKPGERREGQVRVILRVVLRVILRVVLRVVLRVRTWHITHDYDPQNPIRQGEGFRAVRA